VARGGPATAVAEQTLDFEPAGILPWKGEQQAADGLEHSPVVRPAQGDPVGEVFQASEKGTWDVDFDALLRLPEVKAEQM
jgi:hypothetical protein